MLSDQQREARDLTDCGHTGSNQQPLNRFLLRIQRAGYWLPSGLTGYLWLKGLHPGLPGWSCPLRALTGIPCPTCFLTRATNAALTGDLSSSLEWHVFGPLVAGALLAWSLLALRQRRLIPRQLRHASWLPATAALALLGYWLLRLSLSYGFGMQRFPGFPMLS